MAAKPDDPAVLPAELPEPLTPADCNLRGYSWFPVEVTALRDNNLASIKDAEPFRCGMLLFAAAWHQTPAASLPSDHEQLARLAGYGRDLKTFRRAWNGGASHGWSLCSDGRLYHSELSEKANSSFAKSRSQLARTEAARLASLQRRKPTDKARQSAVIEVVTQPVTACATESVTAAVTDSKGEEREEREEREESKQQASVPDSRRTYGPLDCAALHQPPSKFPKLGDPPNRWADFAESGSNWEVDKTGVNRPVFAGCYADQAMQLICGDFGVTDDNYRGDFDVALGWLRDGIELEAIRQTVRSVAARAGKPISRLKYFDQAVREQRNR